MHRTRLRPLLALLAPLLHASGAPAQTHVIPGPSEPGYDAALDHHAALYDLQMHALSTVPLGWGLEAYVHDPAARAAVTAYLTSGTTQDFQTATGMHPYSVVSSYGESGDLGMFGGVGAAGDCFRYEVLRDQGGSATDVSTARARVVRVLDGLHWYTQITGTPGVTARGLLRIASDPGEPPPPDPIPATVPFGTPTSGPVWRADRSGQLPFLEWFDDTSKDQLDGYIFALGACYDAIHGDVTIDATLEPRLAGDALAIAHMLMTPVALDATHTLDLVIVDADGQPTSFHDLNALLIGNGILPRPLNGWNAWLALGMIRTLYAVSGDRDVGRYYYEELVGRRHYFDLARSYAQLQYTGNSTNYSNVNMAFVAAYGVLRFETDPNLAAAARDILEHDLYAPGVDREAKGLQQSFFDFMYAAFRVHGVSDADGMRAAEDGVMTLRAFPDPPYWDVNVTNCDDAEIMSLMCTASDGTPLPLAGTVGHGNGLVAVPVVPYRLRPPSDFEWRSDPHRVNGGGSDLLMSGQDFQAAYWMARLVRASDDGMASISANGRDALPIPMTPDAGVTTPDAGIALDVTTAGDVGSEPPRTTNGCGCRIPTRDRTRPLALCYPAAAAVAIAIARRRRRSRAARQ